MPHAGLIVGLGNPGQQYDKTRHNFGFMVVDRIVAHEPECRLLSSKSEKDFLLWEWKPRGLDPWLLLKPLTFMNLSGRAVHKVLAYRKVDPGHLLVIHDELDLPLGRIRFKKGGGLAGHNGLRSIASMLATRDFHRLRMGIDRPQAGRDVTSYVLGRFSPQERPVAEQALGLACEGVSIYCRDGIDQAMQVVHGR
ncbi:aminoacyl-tRNA hydrolase [Desulfoplanes formicivorans]|uniref:Peptidyl-tRNA hydrolase n=1 Tax=Desulfoplanes formicivorans TaxID=1592317 RepID=A0A194ALC6_9BACT|nr:aminoacyl-tRNA hydrolase [Desulfoplanes formicivorans]GAU09836.1 peptidyl-tRNA hydrolase [Desulfoplanes formicivorans]